MYTVAYREWATSLCTPDAESCTVATLLPCHVYAKLKPYYCIHFISYAMFVLCIRNVYTTLAYYHTYECPSSKVEQCIHLDKSSCSSYYMTVDGVDVPCLYHEDAEICIFSEEGCIRIPPTQYTWLGILSTFCYLCLFFMNYSARKQVRVLNHIEPKHECIASSACSICGLAQAYREIV
jgi:hypothetical protein